MLRTCLLGLVTALIVARPLVLGEDPGLTEQLSDPSGLVLTLLWLAAALGWTVWRAWSREPDRRPGKVEAGLAVLVMLVFISTFAAARYRHAALLASFEWLVLLAVLALVRRLPRTEGENGRLLAALLASGVSLSAYAVYQRAVEFPQQWEQLRPEGEARGGLQSDPEKLRQALAREGIFLAPDDPALSTWDERIHAQNVFSTFAHPNGFAGFLALLLPAAFAAVLACRREGRRLWRALPAAGCALLMAAALWLTHSRGAILGTLLACSALLLVLGRRQLMRYRLAVLGGLALLAGGVLVGWFGGWALEPLAKAYRSVGLRGDYWTATWAMIRDHLWLGVGPGNFGRYYPRYMLATAFEKISDPHNFVLEVWATSGILALAALLAALGFFYWRVLSSLASGGTFPLSPLGRGAGGEGLTAGGVPLTPDPSPQRGEGSKPPATAAGGSEEAGETGQETAGWAFYPGGTAGLALGFVLWALGQSADQLGDRLLTGAVLAGGRSLVWFAAFAVFEGVPWSRRGRAWALSAGVTALLLNLCISGGISQPSVAQPLWFAAALALNALPEAAERRQPRSRVAAVWPVPLTAAVCLVYFLLVFLPVFSGWAALAEARRHYATYAALTGKLAQSPQDPALALECSTYLRREVLKPLKKALDEDPTDVQPRLEFAHWYEERMRFFPEVGDDDNLRRMVKQIEEVDPENPEAYLAEYRMWDFFARRASGEKAADAHRKAARALQQVVDRDPTEARLRYQLAEALFQAGQPEEGRRQAREALKLDRLSTSPLRRLSRSQREQARNWLDLPPETGPG